MDEDFEETLPIKLKDAINVNDLCSDRGLLLEFDDSQQVDENERDKREKEMFPPDLLTNFVRDATMGADESSSDPETCDLEPFEKLSLKMESLIPDGGIKKLVLRPGTGPYIKRGFKVLYHYSSYLEYADEPFDSSLLRNKPESNQPGFMGLIIGLESMRKYEKAQFLIKPQYAFGLFGCPPRIPGNSTLLYEVEVLDFFDYVAADAYEEQDEEERRQMPFQRKIDAAKAFHRKGNDNFKEGIHGRAKNAYQKAIRILEGTSAQDEQQSQESCQLLYRLYSNIAMTFLELHEPERACSNCQYAFNLPGKFPHELTAKLYYRYSKAKIYLADFKSAHKFLKKAQNLAPNNKEIGRLMEDLVVKEHKAKEREQIYTKRMFSAEASKNAEDPTNFSETNSSPAKTPVTEDANSPLANSPTTKSSDSSPRSCPSAKETSSPPDESSPKKSESSSPLNSPTKDPPNDIAVQSAPQTHDELANEDYMFDDPDKWDVYIHNPSLSNIAQSYIEEEPKEAACLKSLPAPQPLVDDQELKSRTSASDVCDTSSSSVSVASEPSVSVPSPSGVSVPSPSSVMAPSAIKDGTDPKDEKSSPKTSPDTSNSSAAFKIQRAFESHFVKQLEKLKSGEIKEFEIASRLTNDQRNFTNKMVEDNKLEIKFIDSGRARFYKISPK